MQPRTKRQKEVFDFIVSFTERNGHKPSYQKIAHELGLRSKGGVAKHIQALENLGLLTRYRENGSFALEIQSKDSSNDMVCEVQWLEAPFPDDGAEDYEDEPLFVPYFLLGYNQPEKIRAFRVRNEAMIEEHICEDDIALVELKSFARDGEIVVALAEEKELLLEKFYRDGAMIEFRPSNKRHEPRSFPADQVEILGIYRGLLRPI